MLDQNIIKKWRKTFLHGENLDIDTLRSVIEKIGEYKHELRPGDNEELLPLYNASGHPLDLEAPRWVCHVLGLRHRCIHILLSMTNHEGQSLLLFQLRSWSKDDSGGHLDITVGGHMTSDQQQSREQVAWDELNEELSLCEADLLNGLSHITGYDYQSDDPDNGYYNYEWRDVYHGELHPNAVHKIHFADGEVGGLMFFPLARIDELLSQSTIPLASGLKFTLPLIHKSLV